jgi:hypothetical protein
MCYYITAILPEAAELNRLRPIARNHALALKPFKNASLQELLSRYEHAFSTASGGCQCGTVLGSERQMRERVDRPHGDVERKIVRLRKTGWTEAKIERWREQHLAVDSRNQRVISEHTGQRSPEADAWVDFVKQAIFLGGAPSIGILLHWYRRMLETESIAIARRETVSLETLQPALFLNFEDDVLYTFIAGTHTAPSSAIS